MVLAFFLGLCIASAVGLRGPHHPRSSVSHHHYSPQKGVKLTQDTELLHDATHLKEDMGPISSQLDFSKLSEQEVEFLYFKAHDIDNNTKLDGLEILYAIQHTFHEHNMVDEDRSMDEDEPQIQEDELPRLVGLIDRVLEEDDSNNDGYLGYDEYVLGRRKDHITQAKRIARNNIKN
ncbi:PREDICTED: multiple coagulation factor deficiency protein 2 homolog [Polistes canadensis]|uniref:multiple coagulation factor deficiency protein 2 homolog n=1 Tax=Polistes canadensis TaxID=91411 RepID=UPI000718DD04|nr:PREDICTED: multiple coagulation factor deficiency protein 2 homolog [Polistes canadensis]XP_014600745.1 PREDICTED: multiple coagulation factor deficiency protein 2 homolog [Polistes canadensis]